jgi:hypothetical protein
LKHSFIVVERVQAFSCILIAIASDLIFKNSSGIEASSMLPFFWQFPLHSHQQQSPTLHQTSA